MAPIQLLVLLLGLGAFHVDSSPLSIIAEFEERANIVRSLYAKYEEMIKTQDREEATHDFLSSYNETNRMTYSWLVVVLTCKGDDETQSLIAAAFKKYPKDLEKAMELINEAQKVFELAAQIKEIYLIKAEKPKEVVAEFVQSVRQDAEAIVSTIKQKVTEFKEKRNWKEDFLQDVTAFVNKYRSTPDIHHRALKYLRENYPFRAWLVVRHAPTKSNVKPRKACLQSEPSAQLHLDGLNQLFIVHADKTVSASAQAHARQMFAKVADSKWTGWHCDRYGETIYREMQYTCGAAKVKHALVSVLYGELGSEVAYASTNPELLMKKTVHRKLWPFCSTYYQLLVFA